MLSDDDAALAIRDHYRAFFAGHPVMAGRWPHGPATDRLPGFSVLEVGPGPQYPGWTYLSVGAWAAAHDEAGRGLEFVVSVNRKEDSLVELLTIAAYFHAGLPTQRLGVGRIIPIGRPWLPGSLCDHLLVGLPYAYGPELEICDWPGGQARTLELLPVTTAERDFKLARGHEALERRLQEAAARTADPGRPSVV